MKDDRCAGGDVAAQLALIADVNPPVEAGSAKRVAKSSQAVDVVASRQCEDIHSSRESRGSGTERHNQQCYVPNKRGLSARRPTGSNPQTAGQSREPPVIGSGRSALARSSRN